MNVMYFNRCHRKETIRNNSLRPRYRDRQKISQRYNNSLFIVRMLYKDSYWLRCFSSFLSLELLLQCVNLILDEYMYISRVRQITVAQNSGPKADKFLRQVQRAAAGPPWNMTSPRVVSIVCCFIVSVQFRF